MNISNELVKRLKYPNLEANNISTVFKCGISYINTILISEI